MTEKAWFMWERGFNGRWSPAVLYGDRPRPKKEDSGSMIVAGEVPPDCLSYEGSPIWGKLERLFPMPKEKDGDETA